MHAGETVAALEDVGIRDRIGRSALDGVSLTVRRGEIVGVAGVDGNGQRELAFVLAGRLRTRLGRARLPTGIGFIPQDRTREGLVADFDIVENVALALHDDERYGRAPLLRWSAIRRTRGGDSGGFEIRAPSVDVRARTLSGGNQQRLVVGGSSPWLRPSRRGEPDARARRAVDGVRALRAERLATMEGTGPGIVLISTDLDEVLALADRVVVMTRGRVAVPLERASYTRAGRRLMLGGQRDRT
jgi:general nucleoside transport system ATP-binding protein